MSAKSAKKKPSMADTADIHELYEESVQNVPAEVEFVQNTFRQIRGREAHSFREDFCGTASAACQWVRTGDEYTAVGVDIDPDVSRRGRTQAALERTGRGAQAGAGVAQGEVRSGGFHSLRAQAVIGRG